MNNTLTADRDMISLGMTEALRVLEVEADAVLRMKGSINDEFARVLEMIINSKGRVIFTGMGKSGIIAKKLAATFSSTGTPAFFVHAGEALHGDLGMITDTDVIIAISNSGETEELLKILPSMRRIGAKLVALTGNQQSTLAQYSDACLYAGVEEEACPHGLAPTASTTATLALGDALAIALSGVKGFTPEDFALYHPGGSLGRRLLTKVADVLEIRQQNPLVDEETTVKDALFKMTKSKMGSTSVINTAGQLVGIITDGDIRRLLEKSTDFLEKSVGEAMTADPITITTDRLAVDALKIMEDKEISDLPVVKDGKPVGMLNFQDLLRAKVI